MRPNGTIYRNAARNSHGETRIYLTQSEKRKYKRNRFVGAILASLSITSVLFFYGPSFTLDLQILESRLESSIDQVVDTPESNVVLASDVVEEKPIEKEPTSVAKSIKVESLSLSIPAINAESNVVYNVNPFDRGEYLAALQKGIAHASTSSLPGQGSRIYYFAHSTNSPLNFNQFNAVFYQLRLLKEGDEIITSLNGIEHKYRVKEKHVVSADDTHWLTENSGKEELVLQTCDPPGTTLRRLLIVAEPF